VGGGGRERRLPAWARVSFAAAGPCSEPGVALVRTSPASAAEGHQAQATAGERSRPRSRPPLSAAAAWLRARLITRGVGGRLAGNNPIHALAVGLVGLEPQRQLLAHHGGKKPPHRVWLPAGASHDRRNGGAARPAQQPQHPRLLRIRSPVVLAAAGCLRPHFGWSLRLGSSPTFALGHPKLLSLVPAQHRAATTQTPRRPTGAGGGEERSHQACCP